MPGPPVRDASPAPDASKATRTRARLRRALLLAIGALYLASVPWYRAADPSPALWLGLPSWVTVAVACYVAVAVLNALAWWLTDVPDADGTPADVHRESAP